MSALLKPIHEADKKQEMMKLVRETALFSRVPKSPVLGDFLKHKYAIAYFRQNLRATSASHVG